MGLRTQHASARDQCSTLYLHGCSKRLVRDQVDVLDAAALRSAFGDERWDTVLDCTLLPCLDEALQEIYIANLTHYVRTSLLLLVSWNCMWIPMACSKSCLDGGEANKDGLSIQYRAAYMPSIPASITAGSARRETGGPGSV